MAEVGGNPSCLSPASGRQNGGSAMEPRILSPTAGLRYFFTHFPGLTTRAKMYQPPARVQNEARLRRAILFSTSDLSGILKSTENFSSAVCYEENSGIICFTIDKLTKTVY